MILRKPLTIVVAMLLVSLAVAAVASLNGHTAPGPSSTRPVIVSGVSQWAALATQVVGADATVVSLLSDPNADPHSHEATTSDAANVSRASLVIENGAGYDTWLEKLVQARPQRPLVINVASLLGVRTGSNPHIFYSLRAAEATVRALAADLSGQGNFPGTQARAIALLAQLATLRSQVGGIARSCSHVKVAATEDVTGYLLQEMGLSVVTPESLRLAVGNSVDPSVGDLALALAQLRAHPAFLVNNVQTATPLTNEMVAQAVASKVPVINVTETMTGTNYVKWLSGVIKKMRDALRSEGCLA